MSEKPLMFVEPGRVEIYCHRLPAASRTEETVELVQVLIPLERALYNVIRPSETGRRRVHKLGARDILAVPPGQPHIVEWRQPADIVTLRLSEGFIAEALDRPHFRLSSSFTIRDPFISAAATQIRSALRENRVTPAFAQAMATAVAYRIGAERPAPRGRLGENVRVLSPAQLAQIDHFIEDHLDQEITLDELATLAGLSKWHFMRRFNASRGASPHDFIVQRRLERAQQLLATSRLSITAIALDVGMSHSHFSRTFLSRFGLSPREYRRARSD